MTSPARSAEFVDRVPEMTDLGLALEAANRGSPSLVLLGADAGVGKTRLLKEFIGGVAGPVLWGGCLPMGDRGLPFAPIVGVLRGLQSDPDLEDLISPAILALLSPPGDEMEIQTSKSLLYQELLDLLERLSAQATTVVVLEDLHWADQWTRELLTFLVANLKAQRLLLIGSYRSDNLSPDDPLRGVMAELIRQPHVERLELAPFTLLQIADQIDLLTGSRPSPDIVEQVADRTQGNAFFVEELVAADGHTGRDLPASLRDLLLARARVASRPSRRLLGIASLAVTEVDDSLLAQVSGTSIEEIRDQLHELIDTHLLVSTAHGVRFRHSLLQEALQHELLMGERREYHAAYARALKTMARISTETGAAATAELAYHLQEAGDLTESIGAWVEAATAAETVAAFAEAHHCLASALAAWESVEDPERLVGGTKVEVLTRAADDAFNGGDPIAATDLTREALGLVDESAAPLLAGTLYERLSRYLRETPEHEKMSEAVERAVALVPAHPPSLERARVLAGYAGRLLLLGRLRDARMAAEEAVEMARQVRAPLVECTALNTLGVVTFYLDDESRGIDQIEAALTLASKLGDPYEQMRGFWNISVCASEAGNWEKAVDLTRRAIEELPRLGHAHQLPELYGYLQKDLMELGRFEEARQAAEEAITRFPSRRDEAVSVEYLIAIGDFATARRLISVESRRDVFGDEEARAELMSYLADLETWEGDTEVARESLDMSLQFSAGSDRPIARARSLGFGMRCEADAAVRARSRRRASDLKLAIDRGRTLHRMMEEIVERAEPGPERRVKAIAALCEGEHTRLIGESDPGVWAEALEAAESVSMVYVAAYIELRLAEAMVASDGYREEAAQRARRVHEQTSRWGTRPLRELVEHFASRARIDVGVKTPRDRRHGLTPRERQVLDLVAGGASNRQIAEELFISEKTASVHVSNVIRKLGVASRGEAGSMAHEKGWVGA